MHIPKSVTRTVIFAGIAFSAFTTLFICSAIPKATSQSISTKNQLAQLKSESLYAASYFSQLTIKAKAAYVFDVSSGQQIFAKNETAPLPLASLTKVMTMLVARETVPQDTVVTINKAALANEGDNGLILNEQWRLKDLMDFSLMVSSNDGAEAIGQTTAATINRGEKIPLTFPTYMNHEAKKISMASTTYANASGLDINIKKGIAGAVGSARDMAILVTYVLKNAPDVLETTKFNQRQFTSLSGKLHIASNTDLIINQVPNIIASKTGYTLLAGGNLAVAFDAGLNEPIVMVLLGSTQNGRFTDMLALASSTQAYLTSTSSAQFIQALHVYQVLSASSSTHMRPLVLDTIKIFTPAVISFFIGIVITPLFSHYFYQWKLWKRKSRKLDSTELAKDKISEEFKQIHNEDGELSTPRVGGMIIWVSVIITIFVIYFNSLIVPGYIADKLSFLSNNQTILPLFSLLFASLIGLADDLLQILGGEHLTDGISRRYRILVVLLIAAIGAWWFYFKLDTFSIHIPGGGDANLGLFFIPFFIVVMLGVFSGGVIDGIDGLAGGVMASSYTAYMIIAFLHNQIDLAAFCAVVVGGILAFLWFNIPPARFYMGETGMLGLSVTLAIIAFLTHEVLLLPIIAFPLFITSISSSLQMFSKKYFHIKIFKVAPIHHHFEALGWPSYKVTMRYWVLSIIFAMIGVMIALIG